MLAIATIITVSRDTPPSLRANLLQLFVECMYNVYSGLNMQCTNGMRYIMNTFKIEKMAFIYD